MVQCAADLCQASVHIVLIDFSSLFRTAGGALGVAIDHALTGRAPGPEAQYL